MLLKEATSAYDEFMHRPLEVFSENLGDSGSYLNARFSEAFASAEITLNSVVTLCWFGKKEESAILATLMHLWGTPLRKIRSPIQLRQLPALLLLYAGGIAALHNLSGTTSGHS